MIRPSLLPAALCLAVLSAHALPARAAGDADRGKAVFAKCSACHSIDAPKNRVGPYLMGVVGRAAAQVADYRYSKAMIAAGEGGLVWDEATLTDYLAGPKAKVPGTKMSFSGLKTPEDIADVIAYLKAHPAP
ncbi:c-type cytochrome [Ensifer soli]|uniref:c-type cytochrome n=1 Tax=Ciceribacter sp. sgz301302 TaxID=3342379 RepID=UPI0035B7AD2A